MTLMNSVFRRWLSGGLYIALPLICLGIASAQGAGAPKGNDANKEIRADVFWNGEVVVNGKVTVFEGATLTLAPNTTVKFGEGAGLCIRGKIRALGERDKPITFTSLQKREPAAWDMVEMRSAIGCEFSHCIVEYATWGLHGDFAKMTVKDCLFRNNEGGLKFMSGFVEIKHCLFEGNTIGIRWKSGNGVIEDNIITRNKVGLFVKEKGGKLALKNNDIFANSRYNMRMGDYVDEDLDARSNWWGPGNPSDTIYDGRNEPGLGKVRYEPYLSAPVRPTSAKAK